MADTTATTPEPSTMSPSASPSKLDRKRKRIDEPSDPSTDTQQADEQMTDAPNNATQATANEAPAPSTNANGAETDASAASSDPKKKQLSKKIQSLLGIPSSSASKRQSTDAELSSAAQKVDELVLSSDDAHKLSAVLRSLDAADLIAAPSQADIKGKARTSNGSSTAIDSLQDVLQPGTKLRELRARLLSMRQPLLAKSDVSQHLQATHGASTSQAQGKDLTRLSSLTLLLGLVDQLAARMRQADASTDAFKGHVRSSLIEERARWLEAKNAHRADASDASDNDSHLVKVAPVHSSAEESAATRYALHMRLPRGDYFTKAIPLDRAQLAKLDPAQADLVQISAQSEAQMRALKRQGLVPTPTLGQRLGRSSHRHRSDSKRAALQQHAKPHPVSFLNYGNYASFAPTYDSSASTLSYATSSTLWRNSVRAQRSVSLTWGPRPFQSWEEEEEEDDDLDTEEPLEPAPFSAKVAANGLADGDGDISMDAPQSDETAAILRQLLDGVDEDNVSESLKTLRQDELVTSHLRFNMMLLHRLQEFQWARLRKSYRPTASGRSGASAIEDDVPSVEEEATAALLLESLSSLVALQPRAADLASQAVQSLVPDASTLRVFSASSGAIDPDLLGDIRGGFWGALDANVVKVSKTGGVTSETPLVLRDNDTIRLAEGSGSKAKKSARRTGGPSGNHIEDRGRGALERFAASRTYDHKQDRHDIEPARAASAPGAGAEQRPSSATPGNLPRDLASPAPRPGPPLAASPQPRQQAVAMSPNARMHPGYAPGAGPAMTPQAQRLAPGPNSSYAFASPAGGLSQGGRPMPQNASGPYPQPSFPHPAPGQANWTQQSQPARQS